MYKHLLVPVDGSELTERAMRISIQLAKQLGAAITGFVAETTPPLLTGLLAGALQDEEAREPYALSAERAGEVLAKFEAAARAAGVAFHGVHEKALHVDRAIVAAAESRGCDMIVMATHGRGAFGEFLFGSQTKAVLAGSKLPLLVLH